MSKFLLRQRLSSASRHRAEEGAQLFQTQIDGLIYDPSQNIVWSSSSRKLAELCDQTPSAENLVIVWMLFPDVSEAVILSLEAL